MTDPSQQTSDVENPVARARARLEAAGVHYEILEHAPVFTASDEADAAGREPGETAKTLVLIDQGRVRLAVIPASRRLDVDQARRALGAGPHLRLATEEEAAERFPGFEVGAVPPFAAEAIPEVIDTRLLYHDTVLCSAGDHRRSVLLDPRDLFRLAEPRVADICTQAPGEHRFADLPRV